MKTVNIYFPEFKKEISYLIGQNARDNFAVIDEGNEDDIWFHAKDDSSCHVICILPNDLTLNCNEKKLLILNKLLRLLHPKVKFSHTNYA